MNNARNLAMRDPALAAIMGVALLGSTDFGAEGPGTDFGNEFAADPFGAFAGFSNDYGTEMGIAPHHGHHHAHHGLPAPQMNQQQAAALWRHHMAKVAAKKSREALLDPNADSELKVERYSFTISDSFTMGVAKTFTQLFNSPDVKIRPQRMTTNAPSPMFVFLQDIKVANVSVLVGGSAQEDAFNYSALAVGAAMDIPTITPSNKCTITANYTGFVPPGFVPGTASVFTVSFKGPSEMVG